MPRFAEMLRTSYLAKGHSVEIWAPQPCLFRRVPRGRWSKWAGYFDQYVIFPFWVRRELKRTSPDTVFVFCDQALGPWVPLVEQRPHVVHVHDLLALRSALGDLREHRTGLTGRIYQRFIRRGFRHARHFISVSKRTQVDLNRFGGVSALTSEVVYNGMNYPYTRLSEDESSQILQTAGLPLPVKGMLLHVGGGQWYKNLAGIVAIYAAYVSQETDPLPLWCIGPPPNAEVRAALSKVPPTGNVQFFRNIDTRALQAAYSRARAFLFPSLAEGFGWPLVEAQACGCPVITTDDAPMNEVAGEAAVYLPRLSPGDSIDAWAAGGAAALRELLAESSERRELRSQASESWVRRFDRERAMDACLAIYARVLDSAGALRRALPHLGPET